MQEWESVSEITSLAGSAGVGAELPSQDGNDPAAYEYGKIFDTVDFCYSSTIKKNNIHEKLQTDFRFN